MVVKRAFSCLWRLVRVVAVSCAASSGAAAQSAPIVFVTQPPHPADFATVNSTFGNQSAGLQECPRGGDLYIRYPDGTLRNLTKEAGFGMEGLQGADAIAVRDPGVHWDGKKVIFSMVVGAARKRYDYRAYRWQIYEATGLGRSETALITKVAGQPEDYNNVMPTYASDDSIIFVSDRTRGGERHLYPQRDEYESTRTNTGIWRLDPRSGALSILDHAPSGAFDPIIDGFGRIVFTRWDHLQRDQQKDAGDYGAFNYESESPDAPPAGNDDEVFPEARAANDPDRRQVDELHTINHFFPWMMNQDGTELETLNHVGRHELFGYFNRSRNDDRNLDEFIGFRNTLTNMFQIAERPGRPGSFLGIDAPEFGTHAAGGLVGLNGAPGVNPEDMRVTYLTHPDTSGATSSPRPGHSGLYRDPIELSGGELVAVHTAETREDENLGTRTAPVSRYDFRLKLLEKSGEYWKAGAALTPGIRKTISFWDPDELVTYTNAPMWELQPAEIVARTRPAAGSPELPEAEKSIFTQSGVEVEELRAYLRENDLALMIGRDVTTRDVADRQQPFNLRVAGGTAQTLGGAGKIYDVSHLQLFQGDLIRAYGGPADPERGRRVLARPMHDAINQAAGGPPGSVRIAADGSVAAFVPARRALTWQLVSPDQRAVVRERYWLTFQPGEIRVCGSCHGVNRLDQSGGQPPENPPLALGELLDAWKGSPRPPGGTTFSMKAAAKKRSKRERAPLTVEIRSHGGAATSSTLDLSLAVAGVSCGAPIATVALAGGETRVIETSLPLPPRAVKLRFSLSLNGSQVAAGGATLRAARRGGTRARRLKPRKICAMLGSLGSLR